MNFDPGYFETRFHLTSDKDREDLLAWVESEIPCAIIRAGGAAGAL